MSTFAKLYIHDSHWPVPLWAQLVLCGGSHSSLPFSPSHLPTYLLTSVGNSQSNQQVPLSLFFWGWFRFMGNPRISWFHRKPGEWGVILALFPFTTLLYTSTKTLSHTPGTPPATIQKQGDTSFHFMSSAHISLGKSWKSSAFGRADVNWIVPPSTLGGEVERDTCCFDNFIIYMSPIVCQLLFKHSTYSLINASQRIQWNGNSTEGDFWLLFYRHWGGNMVTAASWGLLKCLVFTSLAEGVQLLLFSV